MLNVAPFLSTQKPFSTQSAGPLTVLTVPLLPSGRLLVQVQCLPGEQVDARSLTPAHGVLLARRGGDTDTDQCLTGASSAEATQSRLGPGTPSM